ncbi:MAG TPA: GGDEF domain-containing protein [Tepidisphaeraceae bacterium]|nr:GGDEF domain-containing protein [Tepidisphaeraceae bacterium]
MNEQLVSRIRQCPSLPSLPAIAIQVLDLAQRPEADIAEIARVISKDPALACKILRTVNSSFYGRGQHVSTISHALVILGLQSVKTLVLGFSLISHMSRTKAKGFKHLTYWRRSIVAATAARTIAARINLVQQEEAFLVALLMDIGVLVLDQVLGEQYGRICDASPSHEHLAANEQAALQMTHTDVARLLAEQWKLPPILATPMAAHHDPNAVKDASLKELSQIVSTAGRCADVFVDENAGPAIAQVRSLCKEYFQFDDADALLSEIGTRTKEVAALFEINIGSSSQYEAILKRANEALVELTLKSQQQFSTLKQQNHQLKVAAITDALTGLSNRAHFDMVLGDQLSRACATGKPMALLLMDVDRFKSINDTHGHPAGDQVLRVLGKLLRSAVKPQDLAARYGGEELALILTRADRAAASRMAEIIRRAIEAKPIQHDTLTIPVTASIGVAIYEPGGPFRQVSQLIKAADLAVYSAKHSGRNCVKIFSASPASPASKPAAA